MGITDRLPFSIDVTLLAVIGLTWAAVAIGYHLAGIMPAGRRVWTAGTVLIVVLVLLTGYFEARTRRA